MMTIEEFARRFRARDITSAQVTEECLQRIEADNPRLNAFILVMADQARQQAGEADRQLAAGHDLGPLHGVPVSVKDLYDIRGTATTAASRVRDGHVAERDAPAIAHLRHNENVHGPSMDEPNVSRFIQPERPIAARALKTAIAGENFD